MDTLATCAVIAAASFTSAIAALALFSPGGQRRAARPAPALLPELEPVVFLFEGSELIDATETGRRFLAQLGEADSEWARLSTYIMAHFDGADTIGDTLADHNVAELVSAHDDSLHLRAERVGTMTRFTLSDLNAEGQGVVIDSLSQRAQQEELDTLRAFVTLAPDPAWRTDPDGRVVWANRAYLDLDADSAGDEAATWPLPVHFPDLPAPSQTPRQGGRARRVRRGGAEGAAASWFNVTSVPTGTAQTHFAVPINPLVKAEHALNEFIQTLTKTFAHLPIGLAIFDRDRHLALFNPALVDLTTLSAEFLLARPSFFAFLDRLREARVIPEPKDYQNWRRRMMDLEHEAASGFYEETWTLPSGQTFRVTGRPHPEGALAFLFEDISAEITLTRHFRAELELGQSVVDAVEEAICVFSTSGDLILSNASFVTLWKVDPSSTLGQMTLRDTLKDWQAATLPSPVWGDLRDFVAEIGERAEWSADLTMLTGQPLQCRFVPLPGGETLVGFTPGRLPGRAAGAPGTGTAGADLVTTGG